MGKYIFASCALVVLALNADANCTDRRAPHGGELAKSPHQALAEGDDVPAACTSCPGDNVHARAAWSPSHERRRAAGA